MLARPDNLHSRLVFWLKIVLPLLAIVILSTLFLISRGIRPEDAIPYADVGTETGPESPRMTAPVFAGMTADGAALSLRAAEARLGPDGSAAPGELRGLTGLLETPDGARTDLTAGLARLDPEARQVVLSGDVILATSIGYRITTPGLRLALDRTLLESEGQVSAQAPAFTLEAGAMRLSLADAEGSGYSLVFNQGVRMVYLPGAQGTKP